MWEFSSRFLGVDLSSFASAFSVVELEDFEIAGGALVFKEMPGEMLVSFAESVPGLCNLWSVTSSATVLDSDVSVSSS